MVHEIKKLLICTAILGGFDEPIDPVIQQIPEGWDVDFHRWTDEDFPPVAGLTPRLQYRIPKYFAWQMKPGYDAYLWLDGSMSLVRSDSVKWYLNTLENHDISLFAHPNRFNIKQEVDHIEDHLQKGKPYITPRYKNGFHKEMYKLITEDEYYFDEKLYASTTFIYQNNPKIQQMLIDWWYFQSRYFTCDQIHLPWVIDNWGVDVKILPDKLYKSDYVSIVSNHA